MFVVGNKEILEFQWPGVTTGTVTVQYWRTSASGTKEYLQSDATTFTSTPYSFSTTLSDGIWTHVLTVPLAAAEFTLNVKATHSDTELLAIDGSEYVTNNTLDDLKRSIDLIDADIQPRPVAKTPTGDPLRNV